jgi:hypothetical protein
MPERESERSQNDEVFRSVRLPPNARIGALPVQNRREMLEEGAAQTRRARDLQHRFTSADFAGV